MKTRTTKTLFLFVVAAVSATILNPPTLRAASMMFNINANGTKEVNSSGVPVGDPDGSLVGTLTLDDGTGGTTGTAIFNLTFANLDVPFTGFHIHQAPPTTSGGIVLPFANPDSFRSGNSLAGTIGSLSSTVIDNIFANPGAFYLNLHNGPFGGGAVRDQLSPVPEPSVFGLALAGAALAGIVARRRAKAV
jgi:hypothetical protein